MVVLGKSWLYQLRLVMKMVNDEKGQCVVAFLSYCHLSLPSAVCRLPFYRLSSVGVLFCRPSARREVEEIFRHRTELTPVTLRSPDIFHGDAM